jgi:hypothetical protein
MKKIVLALAFVASSLFSFAQDYPKAEPTQYPFGHKDDSSRGVFGSDDRKEIKDAYGFEDYARATAVMIPKSAIKGNRVYATTLRKSLEFQFKTNKFDESVKFLDQPRAANCTGFLIAPDILVTAGHCIETMDRAEDYVWLFDYTKDNNYNASRGYFTINPDNVFEVKEVMAAYFQDLSTYTDYSFLRLDRKSNRKPYRFRTGGKVGTWENVYTIGSPTGLPLKLADNAIVVDNRYDKWFKNSLDGFPGNSGGPVFDDGGWIEGIHVRGAVELNDGKYTGDYYLDDDGYIKTVNWYSTLGTAGSHAHRITSVPWEMLQTAIYDNVEFAINKNDLDRLEDWLVYIWMIEDDFTKKKGRYEFMAAEKNNLAALQEIMKLSTNKNVVDKNGKNLLFYAIQNKNAEMLEYLLRQGISPNKKSDYGETPLAYALRNYQTSMAKTLINRGASVTETDLSGNTALHLAAQFGYMDIVELLVAKGAPLKVKNNTGWTPRKVARKSKHKSIKKYLKKAEKGKL